MRRYAGLLGGMILAGGKSSRMGRDKAGLMYRGKSMLTRAHALLGEVGATHILTAGVGHDLTDPIPHAGPVGGLLALCDYAVQHDVPDRWLILPVDMPLLSADALQPLLRSDAAAAHFSDHPLPLLLRLDSRVRTCISALRPALGTPRGVSVMRVLHSLQAVATAPPNATCLVNTNTPAEWARFAPAS